MLKISFIYLFSDIILTTASCKKNKNIITCFFDFPSLLFFLLLPLSLSALSFFFCAMFMFFGLFEDGVGKKKIKKKKAFGHTGPYNTRVGFDGIAQAMSGNMQMSGEVNI